LNDPIYLQDIMFTNITAVTFIEPRSDYCVILTDRGQVCVLDCETGELVTDILSKQSSTLFNYLNTMGL
jgi:hypothetical protein